MEQNTLQKLEYHKILTKLSDCASFSLGKECCMALEPYADMETARGKLAETTEARDIYRLYPGFSLGPLRNIKDALHHAEIGGILDITTLTDIADTCRASRQNKASFAGLKTDHPILCAMAKELGVFKTVESAIEKAVTPEGQIADTASPRLYQIRLRLKNSQEKVRSRLDHFVRSPETAKFLQDPIYTLREGRFVVPVKQEYRSHVPGIVHDISSSGATLFIEPLAVMEANNDLLKLQREEEEEINAVLRALSMLIAGFYVDISQTLAILTEMDFIFARARLSEKMDAYAPKLNQTGQIKLVAARHPLLAGSVVPVNITMQRNLAAMIITGPNTGGKTVSLKTVGLLTAMALSGLHIPVDEGTEIAFFKDIFADIGDEQSIEQSLSTFSSHMVNIVRILREASRQSLVLLDELGAGTDPQEGAALAMAILERLYKKGAKIVATTHYSELKAFAYNREGFTNASMEFDIETLSPTYRLFMGIPGKSNAFEIAHRLGMEQAVIERAGLYLRPDDQQVADMIAGLEADRLKTEHERKAAATEHEQWLAKRKELEAQIVALKNQEASIIKQAKEEALRIVRENKAASDALLKELQNRLKEAGLSGKEAQQKQDRFKQMEAELQDAIPERQFAGVPPLHVELGQMVDIPKLNQHGYILTKPNANGDLQVQAGVLKINVNIKDLRSCNREEEKIGQVRLTGLQREKAAKISQEIDLRGQLPDEAIENLDKYLDDAYVAGLKRLRIIHGKGTGALRKALLEYLKGHRLVKSTQMGDYHEGGLGVTIVELDL